MIAYFDAGALVKLFLNETGRDQATEVWNSCTVAATSVISLTEVLAALAAARRNKRLTENDQSQSLEDWQTHADQLHIVGITSNLAREAGELADTFALSGMDAIHLNAVRTIDPDAVCTWDRQLHLAARRAGYLVAPVGFEGTGQG